MNFKSFAFVFQLLSFTLWPLLYSKPANNLFGKYVLRTLHQNLQFAYKTIKQTANQKQL